MAKIRFQKLQGLGNDFVLFEMDDPGCKDFMDRLDIPALCDRRTGVGADGILLYRVLQPGVSVEMVYHNADGSRAETCFNGLRCIALWAVLSGVIDRDRWFEIQSDAGPVQVMVAENLDEAVVELAGGVSLPDLIHNVSGAPIGLEQDLSFSFGDLRGIPVSIGNPHFIVWREDGDLMTMNEEIAGIGSQVEKASYFPHGTNFELAVKVDDRRIRMAVWERGVGPTKACGSGATAAVCSGVFSGRLPMDAPVTVEMAGGNLSVEYISASGRVRIQGPAAHVFAGTFDHSAFTLSSER